MQYIINFIAPNGTSMESSVAEDNSHFERDFICITSVLLLNRKDVPLLFFQKDKTFLELFSLSGSDFSTS